MLVSIRQARSGNTGIGSFNGLFDFVEYQPQYNQNNQQSSQQPQKPIVSSTYRPTVVTTIAPTSQRDQSSYVTSPRTTYQQRPTYQDYDDALVSQVSIDLELCQSTDELMKILYSLNSLKMIVIIRNKRTRNSGISFQFFYS